LRDEIREHAVETSSGKYKILGDNNTPLEHLGEFFQDCGSKPVNCQ
jgi:hypothetical protein